MDPQEDKELSSETNARGSDNAREDAHPEYTHFQALQQQLQSYSL